MDDTERCWALEEFPFLPGVDLTLWLQLLVTALLVVVTGTLLAVAAS